MRRCAWGLSLLFELMGQALVGKAHEGEVGPVEWMRGERRVVWFVRVGDAAAVSDDGLCTGGQRA